MKLFFIGACAMLTYSAIAQRSASIPQKAKEAFVKQYPTVAKAKWEKEKENYEASFLYNKHKMSAIYTGSGQLVETEVAIRVSELPMAARKYAATKGTISEAARITKADGTTVYEAEVNHVDILFNDKGNHLDDRKD